jgi:hypothetical protein
VVVLMALALAPLAPGRPADAVAAAQDSAATKGRKAAKGARSETEKPAKQGAGGAQTGASARRKLVKDSLEAEQRPLFGARDPLPFTLIANFGAIGKNRDSTNTQRHAGTLVVRDSSGAERQIPVQLQTRGHFRLKRSTCSFVNLLVRFPGKKKALKGTAFEGQESLKLGAHCQDDARYERLLRREHLAYRILNTVTPRSFRTRLSTGTYVDSASGRRLTTRLAMWIEHEDDVARRQGAKLRRFERAIFEDMHGETLDQMAIFEYLIGNTDWSIYALHNVRLVVTDSSVVHPVPYDFDFSGLVNAPYASPPPQLQIRSVRDRLYRGPCRTMDQLAPSIARFAAREREIAALLDEPPALEGAEARDAREFLGGFFAMLRDPSDVKQALIDPCVKKPGV